MLDKHGTTLKIKQNYNFFAHLNPKQICKFPNENILFLRGVEPLFALSLVSYQSWIGLFMIKCNIDISVSNFNLYNT